MFDLITWICQQKFENTSTMKTLMTMSEKNQINWNLRGVHFESVYLHLSKEIPLMHAKIGEYHKFTRNNQMPYIMNHNLNVWDLLCKKGGIYFIYFASITYASKSIAFWFENIHDKPTRSEVISPYFNFILNASCLL